MSERKERERVARERAIVVAARRLAETEGWAAVTTRRLSEEIEYSQPVLYSHFRNRQAIITAVAEDGLTELTTAVQRAVHSAAEDQRLFAAGDAYLLFAATHPAVYAAMFELPTDIAFAQPEASASAVAGFDALRAVVADHVTAGDVETATELFWSSLHGLATLQHARRLRHGHQTSRLRLLIESLRTS